MKLFISIWKIENYSYCWHGLEEELVGPEFIVDMGGKTIWTLSCSPGGWEDKNSIAFHLNRCEDGSKPAVSTVKYEFSFLAADGTILKSWVPKGEGILTEGDCTGNTEFVKRNEVLIKKRHRYLTQDTLIAQCKMWIGTGEISETVQSTARTLIRVERVFTETFERFSEIQPSKIKSIFIKTTSEADPAMLMNVFLETDTFSEGRLMVDVVPECKKNIHVCTCKISILDKIGNTIHCGQSEFSFYECQSDHWKFPLSLSKKDVIDNKMNYLPLDTLSLQFHFAFSTGDSFEEIEETICGAQKINRLVNRRTSRSITAGSSPECPSALEDLKSLLHYKILCDVWLKTKTQTFPAHKTVLCARSPVFRAMFTNEVKENVKDYIEVDDVEDHILSQFVLFLYSDSLEYVQWKTASKLYCLADKYQVESLKNKCCSVLIGNLNASNASDVLLLADMHQDDNLKRIAEEFILKHDEAVFSSAEWLSFTKSSPQLAMDTMLLKYEK